jgi:hypothetical protein
MPIKLKKRKKDLALIWRWSKKCYSAISQEDQLWVSQDFTDMRTITLR